MISNELLREALEEVCELYNLHPSIIEAVSLIYSKKERLIGEIKKVKCAQWLLCGKEFLSIIYYNGLKAFAICPFCKRTTWLYELFKKEEYLEENNHD